jgi:SOS-response transcriptional repressor LexA
VEWFNDFVLEIAGKNESTVSGELLNTRSKKELYVGSGIVCLVDDDNLVSRATCERYGRRKALGTIPNCIKKPSLIASINDIVINS